MPRYFLDSSALAKVYHVEKGTPWMRALLMEPSNELFVSSLTVIEIQSVFSQKVREGVIDDFDYTLLKKRFAADIRTKRLLIKNLLRLHQQAAEKLLEKYARQRRLRSLDAVQLGAATELFKKFGIDYFVCADKHLLDIARAEGLESVNPDDS